MIRGLFNVLAVLSLLLCGAALWFVGSPGGRTDTYFRRTAGGGYWLVSIYPGRVSFERPPSPAQPNRPGVDPPPPPPAAWGHTGGLAGGWPAPRSAWNRLGFWHFPNGMRIVQVNHEVIRHQSWVVPTWFVVLP